ncbi:MAG: phosphotransferase [Asgard group archaeon]|nr:phosphotransferase [Asgard group archaeon]
MSDNLKQKLLVELQQHFAAAKIINLNELENHTVNTLFSFSVNNGDYIVKILTRPPTSEHEAHRLKKEADLLKQFRELRNMKGIDSNQLTNVPVPEVVHYESDENKIGHQYYIMNKIQGNALEGIWPRLTSKQREKLVKKFATIVRGIHSITFEMFGEIEQYDCPRQFYSMKSLLKADVRRCGRLLGINKLLPIKLVTKTQTYIEKLLDEASFCETPRLVHTDLYPANIIVKDENNEIEILGILDFEWSYAGDPLFDLISIEHEWMEEDKIRKIFFEEYSQGDFSDLNQFKTEIQIYHALESMKTTALGWVYFHPTKENLTYIENRLEKLIEEE